MSNYLYAAARNEFLRGEYDWESMSTRVILLNSGYVPDVENDSGYADLNATVNVVAFSGIIAPKSLSNTKGYAEMAAYTFDSLTGPYGTTEKNTVTSIVLAKDVGGNIQDCELIAYIDNASGLPVVANGQDYVINGGTVGSYTGVVFRL